MRASILLTLVLGCTTVAAQAPPESVVQAAQRARAEERVRATRVYNEDDLPRLRLLPISIIGPLPEVEDKSNRPLPQKESPSLEARWRARFAAARQEIALAEKEAAQSQRAFDDAARRAAITMDWSFLACPSGGTVFAPGYTGAAELNSLCGRINASRERLTAARAGLLDMEDDLRRAGGYPGWARD